MCFTTWLFSISGLFADLMMAVEFFWHIQQRSDMGLQIVICGTICFHKVVKCVRPAALMPMASASLQYSFQMDVLVQLDGSNWMSVLL